MALEPQSPLFGHDGQRDVPIWQRGWWTAAPVPICYVEALAQEAVNDFDRRSRVEPFPPKKGPLITFHRT